MSSTFVQAQKRFEHKLYISYIYFYINNKLIFAYVFCKFQELKIAKNDRVEKSLFRKTQKL